MPDAWADLIAALRIFGSKPSADRSPFHCEHDILYVMVDPAEFSPAEIEQLDKLGFHVDVLHLNNFYSYRFGSA